MATNLYEYYNKNLPSIAERAKIYESNGLGSAGSYTGSAAQNTALLGILQAAPPANGNPNNGIPTTSSDVTDLTGAKGFVNANQNADKGIATTTDEPSVRTSVQNYQNIAKDIVAGMGTAPAPSNYEASYNDARTQYGLSGLEDSLNSLTAQEAEINAQLNTNKSAESGKPVAMNVIEGRMSEETRQAQEQLDFIGRQKAVITNQLKTKYDIVNSLMQYKQLDYNSAVDHYDKQFSNTLNLINTAKGIEESQKSDTEKAADDARANAQIIINTMKDRGITYDQLSDSESLSLTKMGVESGLGPNFFSDVLKVSNGKELQFTPVISDDKTKAFLYFKDGSMKTISTGLTAEPGSTSSDKEQELQDSAYEKFAKDLADRVYTGEITREQARDRIKAYFPYYDENDIYTLVPDNYVKETKK